MSWVRPFSLGVLALHWFSQILLAQRDLSPEEALRMLVPQNERFQFIASAEGPEAMRLNPASVASSRGINFHYNALIDHGKFLEHDVSLQNFLFNVAYRRSLDHSMDYHLNEYTVSMGFGVPEITFGASVNWLRTDLPGGSNGSLFNLGVLVRPMDQLSIAAVKENINQPEIGGARLEGENILGVNFRPLRERDQLILAVDASLPNKGSINDDVTYKFGANFLVVEGLRVYGVYDRFPGQSANMFSLGFEFYIPNISLSYDARFDEDKKYQNGVAGITLSSEKKKTVFKPAYRTGRP
jgi:hypothetical protein